jgi:hypothetical protein
VSTEVVVLIVIVGLLDLRLIAIGRGEGKDPVEQEPSFPQRPDGWDSTTDGDYWNAKADEARHEQLVRARDAAKNWGQTIAALLGIFATVAFIKGPESLDKIPGDNAYAVVAMIAAAGAAAALAVYYAAIAAQGTPKQVKNFDGWRLKHITQADAASVAGQLRASRAFALIAAVTLLGAMGVAWLASLSARGGETKGQTLLVVTQAGVPTCGTLARGDDGKLVLKFGETNVPLADVGKVVEVDSCPK